MFLLIGIDSTVPYYLNDGNAFYSPDTPPGGGRRYPSIIPQSSTE